MKRIAVVLVPVLGVLGCGGGGGSDDSIPIADLNSRVVETLCRYEVRCGAYPDQNTCMGLFSVQGQLVADVNAGKTKYDGHAAATCLKLYDSLGCNISDLLGSQIDQSQSCADAFKGTVADGGACLLAEDCVSAYCDRTVCDGAADAMCCAGTCQSHVSVGGDCSASGAVCVDGSFCKRDASNIKAVCTTKSGPGQPCSASDECVPGQICSAASAAGTGTGTCANLPAEGQPCPAGFCNADVDVCDPATKTCIRRIAVGAACVPANADCVAYAKCDSTTMKCVARIAAGGACLSAVDCIAGLLCTNGICAPQPDQPACM